MPEYIFTITRREFYRVEAKSIKQAKIKLINSDDLMEYSTPFVPLEDLQPEFTFYGTIMEPKKP